MNRVECRVDISLLKQNFSYLQQCAGQCRLMPVLKHNAYSLGAESIGTALKSAGACRFAVATVEEALDVLKLGLEVQILGILTEDEIPEAVASGIICTVNTLASAQKLSAEAAKYNKQIKIAVKLNTGMNRIGFDPEKDLEDIIRVCRLPNLVPDTIFAHFSTAAKPDVDYANWQMKRFICALNKLAAAGVFFLNIHHAAGYAIVNLPASVNAPFNMARPGGIMYGSNFSSPCRQIITLSACIGAIQRIAAGSDIGYYRTRHIDKDIISAVVTAGYADGIPLALSNRGTVLIHGKHCPIIGRVCMDYTMVDISAVPEAAIGDQVVLLGKQGSNAITVQEWGDLKQTHSHDIWCAIGHRVKITYQG